MDFVDRLDQLASRVRKQREDALTEEATKHAFVLPFISALGYDVFNPSEVVPELTADHGVKKGEKVDYAIKKDGKIVILIECKPANSSLVKAHASQLYRYFSVTEARFAILTNGVEYQFYSDIDESNKMDRKPFFVFNILDSEPHDIDELKKFTRTTFDLDDILATASTLKYLNAVKKILDSELDEPSDEFVRFFASRIYDGRLTAQVMEQFKGIVREARKQFVREKVNQRLSSALSASNDDDVPKLPVTEEESEEQTDGVDTTQEEIDGFNIVRAIVGKEIPVSRIAMRDTKSYCGILLDDNNRKPICRLHFNTGTKYLGLMENKKETRIPISAVEEIYGYAEQILATAMSYD